jgi:transporter family-2 protein
MPKLIYLFPLIAGFCVCFQSTINGYWQAKIGVHSTILVNGFVVALLTAVFFVVANQTPVEKITSEIRPWVALNGICGATIITIAALTFPRIGAASVIVLLITGQLATAVILDHFGFLNLPHHPLTIWRLLGIGCVVFGVLLTTQA